MSDLVQRAKEYATQAHQRIDHKRKYSGQPYELHLKEVAHIVSSVVDDEEMIAAAWLHDTVEDTLATHGDIEKEFGQGVALLVAELTDVSKPGDGNRSVRKGIDRQHLSTASPRGQTVKYADLIDNTRDICKHDLKFARTYHEEATELLNAMPDGDPRLYERVRRELKKCAEKLGITAIPGSMLDEPLEYQDSNDTFSQRRVRRLFSEAFVAKDIAEPLRSFDSTSEANDVRVVMEELDIDVIGVRRHGVVAGFAWRDDLVAGSCGDCARNINRDQMISGDASLSEAIMVLTRHDYCFIQVLDRAVGVVTRSDIEKPVIRMWLFGFITIIEMDMTKMLNEEWPDNCWEKHLAPGRLEKARLMHEERLRRYQHSDLVDCLQLSDKARILVKSQKYMTLFGFRSKRDATMAINGLESLRNHLAHAQQIVLHDWMVIVRLAHRLDALVRH